jgi:hypothetical protein
MPLRSPGPLREASSDALRPRDNVTPFAWTDERRA